MEKDISLDHLHDLAEKSYRQNIYTYSAFLSLHQQQQFLQNSGGFTVRWQFFGGETGAERQLLCFGDEKEYGFLPSFPITTLEIAPVNMQFADRLTHRDFLGALLNLGIERSVLGDIIIRENRAFVFVLQHMADFILENLQTVKHTRVTVKKDVPPPEGQFFTLTEVRLFVSSCRADGVIAALYRLSRSQSQELFRRELVFVNGKTSTPDLQLQPGDLVSTRGWGRFRMGEIAGQSRKGKYYLLVETYS